MKYTIEEIKEELSSYIQDKKYIEDKKADIEEIRAKAEKTTSVISDMPKGSNPVNDRIAEYIIKISEIQEDNYKRLLELEKKKKQIEDIIDQVKQPHKNILYYRYIKGIKLKNIAKDTPMDYKWLCVLHGRALEEYREIKERL